MDDIHREFLAFKGAMDKVACLLGLTKDENTLTSSILKDRIDQSLFLLVFVEDFDALLDHVIHCEILRANLDLDRLLAANA